MRVAPNDNTAAVRVAPNDKTAAVVAPEDKKRVMLVARSGEPFVEHVGQCAYYAPFAA